tara:strand:+ start:521 stop:793 length:273 start_codon:yes stop_codon:yes gene_type:complete
MSGYVSKRVSNTRTAMGTTDQRPTGSGSVMLGLVSSVGSSRAAWRKTKKRAYTSIVQKDCKQNVLTPAECVVLSNNIRESNNAVDKAFLM